jgi:hypothetical protein
MNRILSSLPMNEKLAVVQLGYQLIGSAKQAPLTEEDDPSIDYIIDSIGLGNNPMAGNLIWNEGSDANKVNPFSAFETVSCFSSEKKHAFKSMIEGLCSPDLIGYTTIRLLRIDIARQIYQRIGL